MAVRHHTPNSANLKPGEPLLSGGYDWSWCFVVFSDVPEFPGYCAGSNGTVWSAWKQGGASGSVFISDEWKQLKPWVNNKYGHLTVALYRDKKRFLRGVQQVVLEAFVGPCPVGMEACHYPDTNPSNNHLHNLRWDSHFENMKDRYRDRPPATEKFCRRCGTMKPHSEFYADKRRLDGLKADCKPCHNKITVLCNRRRRYQQEATREAL